MFVHAGIPIVGAILAGVLYFSQCENFPCLHSADFFYQKYRSVGEFRGKMEIFSTNNLLCRSFAAFV